MQGIQGIQEKRKLRKLRKKEILKGKKKSHPDVKQTTG